MSLQEFFHMGGYGFYVWTSYGLTAIVLILNVIQPLVRKRNSFRDLVARLGQNRR